jgi:hypothetical protein
MTRITQQKQKFKALGIILKSESQIRTDSVAATDGQDAAFKSGKNLGW